MQLVDVPGRVTVELDDDIAAQQSTRRGRAVLRYGLRLHAAFAREFVEAHDLPRDRHVLAGDTDIAAAHAALADQPRGDELHRVDRDREADALRHRDDRGVDA